MLASTFIDAQKYHLFSQYYNSSFKINSTFNENSGQIGKQIIHPYTAAGCRLVLERITIVRSDKRKNIFSASISESHQLFWLFLNTAMKFFE